MTDDRIALETEAADWVARMDGDGWTAADEAALEDWLGGGPQRRGAYLAAQAAWLSLAPADEPTARSVPPVVSRRAIMAGGGVLAASIAGGLTWLMQGTTYRTGIGEIRHVPLADGSIATINTASDIEVRIAGGRREVDLRAGEAWFQVAKDPSRPFVVQAGPINVEAIGTAFSVRRQSAGTDVLVNEGVVEAWSSDVDHPRVRLVAGQRAVLTGTAVVRVETTDLSSVDRALAWRAGTIDLSGDTLGEAVAEFNRYNLRQIRLSDPALAGETIDGIFRTDDPAGFATAVQASLGVPVRAQSDAIVIGSDKIG